MLKPETFQYTSLEAIFVLSNWVTSEYHRYVDYSQAFSFLTPLVTASLVMRHLDAKGHTFVMCTNFRLIKL